TLLSGSEKLRLREVFTSAWDSESLLGYIRTYVFVRFSSPHGHREIKLVMGKGFLDKVEDNTAVRAWSEMTQHEKCDSLAKGYISELWDFTCISVTQNSLQELKEIWDQWNEEASYRVFSKKYSPLKEIVDTPRRDDLLEEKWMAILQNLREEDVEWRAPWLLLDEILYRYSDFD
ncbi:hypothetical protein Gotur_001454, partial [Gossypium turneri]